MDFLDSLKPFIEWLHHHPHWAGVITGIISFAESLAIVGLLVPGSVIMTAIGTLIGAGVIPAWQTIVWAIAGAIAGDSISYRLGNRFNTHLPEYWPFSRYPQLLSKGKGFFCKHGGKSVFLGRFVGPVRPVVPLIAGMMHFPPKRFFLSNISSAIVWAPCFMLPGILIGAASMQLPSEVATRVLLFLFAALVVLWLSSWLIKIIIHYCVRKVDHGMTRLWSYMKSHPQYARPCKILANPRKPDGHGQLTLLLVLMLFIIGLIALTIAVPLMGHFNGVNTSVSYMFRHFYHPTVMNIMIWISALGFYVILSIATGIVALYLLWRKHYHLFWHLISAFILTGLLVKGMKWLIDSPRPPGVDHIVNTNSFPSGHTTGSVVTFGLLAIIIGDGFKRYAKCYLYAAAILLVSAIIISRLYLGAHVLTDILAGVLLGGAILSAITISLHSQLYKIYYAKNILILALCSLIIAWISYMSMYFKEYQKRYTPSWPVQYVTMDDWWQMQKDQTPIYVGNLIGKPRHLINVQWADSLDDIEQQLTKQGWQPLPEHDLLNILNSLTTDDINEQIPVLQSQFAGKTPVLAMWHKTENPKIIIHLILWPANVRFDDSDTALWYGSIHYAIPHQDKIFHTRGYKQLLNEYPPAIDKLKPLAANNQWHSYSSQQQVPKDNLWALKQQWHGGTVAIKDK